jgi:hypothetical protein
VKGGDGRLRVGMLGAAGAPGSGNKRTASWRECNAGEYAA